MGSGCKVESNVGIGELRAGRGRLHDFDEPLEIRFRDLRVSDSHLKGGRYPEQAGVARVDLEPLGGDRARPIPVPPARGYISLRIRRRDEVAGDAGAFRGRAAGVGVPACPFEVTRAPLRDAKKWLEYSETGSWSAFSMFV